jgi:TonB family protein
VRRLVLALLLASMMGQAAATRLALFAGSVPRLLPREEFERREVLAYVREVARRLTEDQRYPAEALKRGEEGTVGIDLLMGPDGRVRAVRLLRSSGHPELDQAAVARAYGMQGLPMPPAMLRGREFHIDVPVTFRLD